MMDLEYINKRNIRILEERIERLEKIMNSQKPPFNYIINCIGVLSENIDDKDILSNISDWERSVKGIGIDYTFDLFNNFFFDGYLFGEGVGIFFPETVYYIRDKIKD